MRLPIYAELARFFSSLCLRVVFLLFSHQARLLDIAGAHSENSPCNCCALDSRKSVLSHTLMGWSFRAVRHLQLVELVCAMIWSLQGLFCFLQHSVYPMVNFWRKRCPLFSFCSFALSVLCIHTKYRQVCNFFRFPFCGGSWPFSCGCWLALCLFLL